MIDLIKGWGIPELLKGRNVRFVFNSNEISDKINSLESEYDKNYYKELHCKDNSVRFCLYDFDISEILFTMDFYESSKFVQSNYINLKVLYVNNPGLRKKGVSSYYLKKLQEYAISMEISRIKLYANPDDKLFKNKENSLDKKELLSFYEDRSNKLVPFKFL